MCVGFIQSVKSLKKKKITYPEEKGTMPSDCLWTQFTVSTLPWVSSLLANLENFGLSSLHNNINQFLKNALSLPFPSLITLSLPLLFSLPPPCVFMFSFSLKMKRQYTIEI